MSTLNVDTIQNLAGDERFGPVSMTAQATTSGTEFDFPDIPSWVTRITVVFDGVSLNGTDHLLVQLGDSGGFEATSYVSESVSAGGSTGVSSSTTGFIIRTGLAAGSISGMMVITNVTGNDWVAGHATRATTSQCQFGAGTKTLSATLTQVRLTRSGSNTFDAGQVNVIYE